MRRAWILRDQIEREKRDSLSKKWNLSPLVAQLLNNRRIDGEAVERFLRPSWEHLHDPFLMKGMENATQRILKAISNDEKILIYGDYDVDGVTATSLLLLFFQSLRTAAYFYIPQREAEGYGLNRISLEKAAREGIDLVITCDCGISSFQEVKYAQSLGLEVIVTDHHRVKGSLTPSCTVVNPNQPDCPYPFKELAGVGVAFKLVQALAQKLSSATVDPSEYLDLVALGTIADVVSLKDENRVLVKLGLERLRQSSNLGLRGLLSVTGLSGKEITEGQVGFILAPRLNACGRLSLARKAVKLLLATDARESFQLARNLDRENKHRQRIEERMCKEAEKLLPEEKGPVIVLSKNGWHAGIIGLVASYLREKYFRPTVIFSLDAEPAKGSARSIPEFSIFNALEKCEDLLHSFGGHRMAAGMRISKKNIPELRKRLNKLANELLSPEDLVPSYFIDAQVNLEELEGRVFEELKQFPPYGSDNPAPLFLTKSLSINPSSTMAGKGILKASLNSKKGEKFEVIGFNFGNELKKIDTLRPIDVIFTPRVNEFRGEITHQLEIKDFRGEINDNNIQKDQKHTGLS
jgi:single-stranded-DNA-specific exonuclease